tara:strand:- start:104 stop:307 length:204 start_codon:yes stop_codon:yes gene_type:complete
MSYALTNPDDIARYRIRALRSALKLEILGMSRRGVSAYRMVKEEFGFKGSKQKVLDQLLAYIKANNI